MISRQIVLNLRKSATNVTEYYLFKFQCHGSVYKWRRVQERILYSTTFRLTLSLTFWTGKVDGLNIKFQ